ncbi:MAG: hypothetical protein L3J43_05580 [Sulfurovum sp.]|nr:hypothetical protein [Sulfurovum sp.]
MNPVIFIAGTIEVLVGLLHFFMPLFFDKSETFIQLADIEMNFLLLLTYAVGILLVAFGATTILLARKQKELEKILYFYLIIHSLLWTARIVLELLYPVNLEMFGVKPFTLVVLPGLILEWGLFVYATIHLRNNLEKNTFT